MPKKPTKADIKSAAELTIKHNSGSVKAAIASYQKARQFAVDKNDAAAVVVFDRVIRYCEER